MKTISLANSNLVVLVDDEDYDRCSKVKWCLMKGGYIHGRWNGEMIYLHRFILWLFSEDKIYVDHKNHNKLDNKKSNLRHCNQSQNGGNRKPLKGKSSEYKGVSWNSKDQVWVVMIKRTYIGRFHNEKEAASAYNIAAIKIFGEFALLNNIT